MLRRDSTGPNQNGQNIDGTRAAGASHARSDRAATDNAVVADPTVTPAACHQSMASLIADEIIPRLIAAHRAEAGSTMADSGIILDPARLADLAVHSETRHLADLSEVAMAEGLGFDSLMLDVMAPAARLLGQRWEDDTADFIEVTLGLWRLQELVHELASRRCGIEVNMLNERRILCAVAPGDDHSFGSLLLEEMFRRAGWTCTGLRGASRAQLLRQVADGWFEIIALTVSVERNSATLTDLVADLRAASCNPGVSIMVGGPVFNDHASLADEIGADATASNARAALHQAELLVGQYLVGSDRPASRHAMHRGAAGHPAARAGIQPG
jgi:methanogenic corrinoid protein MtbC1